MEAVDGLKIVYLPISALTPYERNAKEHPRRQIDQIKRSISDYGMRDPIGIFMGGAVADMLLTDPPYNVNYEGTAGKIKNDSIWS